MRAITAGGTFAAIAALVGCTTGPDYHAPTVALAPTYLATSRVVVGSQAISADWWNGFGDPQLTRLVEQAEGLPKSLQEAFLSVIGWFGVGPKGVKADLVVNSAVRRSI